MSFCLVFIVSRFAIFQRVSLSLFPCSFTKVLVYWFIFFSVGFAFESAHIETPRFFLHWKDRVTSLSCSLYTGACYDLTCSYRCLTDGAGDVAFVDHLTVKEHAKTKCEQERQTALDKHLIGAFIPECDEKGNYTPLQCHASTGYCWCVDSLGQKIEGTNKPPGTSSPSCASTAPSEHTKTKCEQERQTALNKHLKGNFIPKCDEKGNYTPLQCHGSTGYCWCVDSMGHKLEGTDRPPGTSSPNCGATEHTKTKCEQERQTALNKHLIGAFIPECDEKGNYTPLQCHASTGYCWCVDSLGQKIEGTNKPPGTSSPSCAATAPSEHAKTKCEQERQTALNKHLIGAFIPKCDEKGNYTPLQCHASTGYCWCVDSLGQKIEGTNKPPGTSSPSCAATAPSEHAKTKCEQERQTALNKHLIGAFIPECDEKGNYTPLQCHASTGYCWCVDSLGQKIEGTNKPPGTSSPSCAATAPSEHAKTKCEQERQTALNKHLIGAFIPECDEKGNYTPLQCHASTGYCWCVDSMGQKIEGTNKPPGTSSPSCAATAPSEHPKTKCEQERQTALNKHLIGAFIPQCDEKGNYTPLQCHASTGYCWCVDSMGQKIEGTNKPPGTSSPSCAATDKADYELLCKDGTRKNINEYKDCHLAKVPAHAVVSRKNPELAKQIVEVLRKLQGYNLFSSEGYTAKNLMFKDSTKKLVPLSETTDSYSYLGAEYISTIRFLKKEISTDINPGAIKWCTVGHAETVKCDAWSINTVDDQGNAKIMCSGAQTTDECLRKILRNEADAVAIDGGQVYTAGKCGLVPAMVEQYDESKCASGDATDASTYYAVAVVHKDSGLTWETLKGKKSCHTGLGRTAGWNVPMGVIHKETRECDFSKFFSESCVPGAEPTSSLCALCAGSGKGVGGDVKKCKASSDELYFGYAGAFRKRSTVGFISEISRL
ncbi:saxiphilin-like isoform X2 [Brachyhypopomus gauderio]|uniref:saxiphilin-like isoform X2 n=1 Tax=Brachyhypopomus gauderio TaxID=698409 RepID=UPI004042698A